MRVLVLGSGSSGNAMLVVTNDGARVLVDAGLGPKVLERRLGELGVELFPRRVDAVVVTHHHGDHISHLESLARAFRAPLFLHRGVSAKRARDRWDVREYEAAGLGRATQVAGLDLHAMYVPHDAPQVALALTSSDGVRFGVATDLGHVPATLASFLGACDAALLEANYCPRMLADGPYPPRLKQRVGGGFGHLANEQAADLAARMVGMRLGSLYLGHLSRTNNTPERALAAVSPRCVGISVRTVPHGVSCAIDVTRTTRGIARGEQLALALGLG